MGNGLSRRSFDFWLLISMPFVYGAGILAGILRYLFPVPSRRLPKLDVGAAADYAAGKVDRKSFNGRDIYILHDGQAIRAIDATCTHLTCRVNWTPEEKLFRCYCHGGVFDITGQRKAGPPKSPLRAQPFETTPDGRVVLIDRPEAG